MSSTKSAMPVILPPPITNCRDIFFTDPRNRLAHLTLILAQPLSGGRAADISHPWKLRLVHDPNWIVNSKVDAPKVLFPNSMRFARLSIRVARLELGQLRLFRRVHYLKPQLAFSLYSPLAVEKLIGLKVSLQNLLASVTSGEILFFCLIIRIIIQCRLRKCEFDASEVLPEPLRAPLAGYVAQPR